MLNNDNTARPVFKEIQKLRHWLLWTLLTSVFVLLAVQLTYELIQPKPDTQGIVVLAAVICIYIVPMFLFIFYARLTVRIDAKGISYGWNLPTKDLNFIARENIKTCEIITHKLIGYGYKLTKKYGIVYNTQGRQSLQITTFGGEKLLLGTQKPDEIKQVAEELGILTS